MPLDYNIKLHATNDESLHGATLYKQLVTSLVYLTVTCPDISHAVHILSQFIYSLHPVHFKYCSLHLALSQGHTFMDFSSLLPVIPYCMPILMVIRHVIPFIVVPPLDIAFCKMMY